MKLQKILKKLQELHPKEIDLSLNRIKILLEKLGNPQNNLKSISVVGTNGKYSTIQACFSILKEANFKCNIYTSPNILKINERFIYNNKELGDEDLINVLEEVESINNNNPITFFEILTASYFYKAAQYPDNINLIEAGLFHRFDATNVLSQNLASIVCSISRDHLDWLKEHEQTIEKIIFEKTSALLNSNIIVAKQSNKKIMDCIKKTISQNLSNKIFFNDDFGYSLRRNEFFFYEDKLGALKLPLPNVLGEFQIENISTAIATLRQLDLGIKKEHIEKGIRKITSLARLQEINSGKLKQLVKNNKFIVDGSHNEDGAKVLNEYLQSLEFNKHVIIGMMANKDHKKFMFHFKNITSITFVDIPNQPNSISGKELKEKCKNLSNIKYQPNIEQAIKSIKLDEGDVLIITGSLYLAGEVLKLN